MKNNYLFLTESEWAGKVTLDHQNLRTEYCWQFAFEAQPESITNVINSSKEFIKDKLKNYDWCFIILPKNEEILKYIFLFDLFNAAKEANTKIAFIQEGPHWYWNDYSVSTQLNYFDFLEHCDLILCHNYYDANYYKGLFPDHPVKIIPSLMLDSQLEGIDNIKKQNKAIIGGSFTNWYGGFESYIVASEFDVPIFSPKMGRAQPGEEEVIKQLPYMNWNKWIYKLAEFKYAVHLMPTVAAGTFALNCARLKIPCIGNKNVDTNNTLHSELAVDVGDIYSARKLAERLKKDSFFYSWCSTNARSNYEEYYSIDKFKDYFVRMFEEDTWR